jgi:hypothetical protein
MLRVYNTKGVVENNISSSFRAEQWEEWLENNVA